MKLVIHLLLLFLSALLFASRFVSFTPQDPLLFSQMDNRIAEGARDFSVVNTLAPPCLLLASPDSSDREGYTKCMKYFQDDIINSLKSICNHNQNRQSLLSITQLTDSDQPLIRRKRFLFMAAAITT